MIPIIDNDYIVDDSYDDVVVVDDDDDDGGVVNDDGTMSLNFRLNSLAPMNVWIECQCWLKITYWNLFQSEWSEVNP